MVKNRFVDLTLFRKAKQTISELPEREGHET